MQVSIIVPVKDDDRLFECIGSIARLGGEAEIQLIVVDNGSAPAFRELIAAASRDWLLLDEERPGAYAARNRGLRNATGEVVFFTDADCIVQRGWIGEGLRAIEQGAAIAQGFSGSIGGTVRDRLIQRRYEKHLERVRTGDGTECDTRNLAVRREVATRYMFNDQFRRVGDTEFGLLAERDGFRVGYAPAMRVSHAHEGDLQVFVAKQICHGWGAQRLMQQYPELRWHGGHLRTVAKASRWSRRLPGQRGVVRALARSSLVAAAALDRFAERLPFALAIAALTALDKAGALSGHLMYVAGAAEPSPTSLMGRAHPRD